MGVGVSGTLIQTGSQSSISMAYTTKWAETTRPCRTNRGEKPAGPLGTQRNNGRRGLAGGRPQGSRRKSLRHFFATMLIAANMDPADVQRAMRHSSLRITLRDLRPLVARPQTADATSSGPSCGTPGRAGRSSIATLLLLIRSQSVGVDLHRMFRQVNRGMGGAEGFEPHTPLDCGNIQDRTLSRSETVEA
jgi:hypothetical protein